MAEFDESKVINALHTERAEIGKKYYFEDYLHDLKCAVEGEDTTVIGILDDVDDVGTEPFQKRGGQYWEFIYPYEEPPKKRMTNRQLSEWLAKGNGEVKPAGYVGSHITHTYDDIARNTEVKEGTMIRLWGFDEWIEPTEEIFLRDCD